MCKIVYSFIFHLTLSDFVLIYIIMKIKYVLSKLENFFFKITPPFYLVAVILGCLTVLPILLSPYIDKKNDEYKISLMQNTMRLNKLSLEIYEKNKTIANHQNILITDFALQQSSARRLSAKERIELASIITEQADIHNLDPLLVIALIQIESTFNTNAQSHKGAKGLMQLLPDTARYINKKTDKSIPENGNLFDAETNIALGTAYMEYLLNKTNGNMEYALAAYNMGPANMFRAKRENRVPKAYSNKVLKEYAKLQKAVNTISVAQK